MTITAFILVAAVFGGTEYVNNGDFEQIQAGKPVSWDIYAEPPNGEANVSDTAHSGKSAVMLRNRNAYDEDPCNNWSQALGNIAGKTFIVKAWVKTDGAAAALWLQCWKTRPLRVIHIASSSEKTPITGKTDWTPVEMTATVPQDTDFTVVRCVIKGEGAAWFDDVSITEAPAQEKPAPETASTATPSNQTQKDTPEKYLQMLRETADEVRAYREANEELGKQVKSLQGEIETLKKDLEEQKNKPPAPPTTILLDRPRTTESRVPILVPHAEPEKEPKK